MNNLSININDSEHPAFPICLITIAGFENRVKQSLSALRKWYGKKLDRTIVLDFDDTKLNEPNRSILINEVKEATNKSEVINAKEFINSFNIKAIKDNFEFYFDISGATRALIFKIMKMLMDSECNFSILYTEAETYYPKEQLYHELIKKPSSPVSILDDKIENEDIIYSKNCSIISPEGFTGTIEHGRMPLLIGFLTFKRSRLRCILEQIEFPVKIFIAGKPNRTDLQWRKELLMRINHDNIEQATEPIVELETLCPVATFKKLIEISFINDRYFKYNIYLAPLGSKMQTIGAFFFWNYFKSAAIIFSKPQKYFPKTFSEGARETFVINKNKLIESITSVLKVEHGAK